MNGRKIGAFFFICMMMLGACSSSDHSISVTFSGNTAAFDDAQVVDIVFVVTNVAVDGQILDLDKNGQPDTFVFPTGCGATLPASCGYPNKTSEASLGSFPLNFTYKVEARLRNASGTTVYPGSKTFANTKEITTLDIAL